MSWAGRSPCQSLSVAGRRARARSERSAEPSPVRRRSSPVGSSAAAPRQVHPDERETVARPVAAGPARACPTAIGRKQLPGAGRWPAPCQLLVLRLREGTAPAPAALQRPEGWGAAGRRGPGGGEGSAEHQGDGGRGAGATGLLEGDLDRHLQFAVVLAQRGDARAGQAGVQGDPLGLGRLTADRP
jgi:hypothetical protein